MMLIGLNFKSDLNENDIIDMNDIDLDTNNKLSVFLYIRNCGLKNKLYFGNCNYEDKEFYLLNYMKKNIDITSEELSNTWVSIISDSYIENSILTIEEIISFQKNNEDYINIVKQFISSLVLYKVYKMNKDKFDINIKNNIKQTDFEDISLFAIEDIFENHKYLLYPLLLENNYLYFKNIFTNKNAYLLINIINKYTPFNGILSIILSAIKNKNGEIDGINN